MGNKLFVGGLSWGTTDASLRAAFEPYGSVSEAKVITDRETGRSRGFGFVTMGDQASAEEAKSAMDGAEIDGRRVRVDVAQERGGRRGGGGGRGGPQGGGGGGGYRDGGGGRERDGRRGRGGRRDRDRDRDRDRW